MAETDNLDDMWDEAFSDLTDEGDGGEENDPVPAEAQDEGTQTDGDDGAEDENDPEGGGQEETGEDNGGGGSAEPQLTPEELAEVNAELGTDYSDASEFPQSRRYVELRENGRFTAREALAAVGAFGKTSKSGTAVPASKGHITASRGRGSNGEVMTSADKQELAKWGFKTEGKELEKAFSVFDKRLNTVDHDAED